MKKKLFIFFILLCILLGIGYVKREDIFLFIKGYNGEEREFILSLEEESKQEYLDLDQKIDFSYWDSLENQQYYYDYYLYETNYSDEQNSIVEKVDYFYANEALFQSLDYSKDYIREHWNLYSKQDLKDVVEIEASLEEVEPYLEITNRILSDVLEYEQTGLNPLNAVLSISYPFIDSQYGVDSIYEIEDKEDVTILVKRGFDLTQNYEPVELIETDLPVTEGASDVLLQKEAGLALMQMADDMEKEGLYLGIRSAYRSYETQQEVYNYYLETEGQDYVNGYVSIPGFSEHQTGLGVDLTSQSVIDGVYGTFGETAEYNWVIENGYKYGFILRYPEGKEYLTGVQSEPWHFRYVGTELAKTIHENNMTLEEYILQNGFSYAVEKEE